MGSNKSIRQTAVQRLLPRPQKVEIVPGRFVVSRKTRVVLEGPRGERALFAVKRFGDLVEEECGIRLDVTLGEAGDRYRMSIRNDADAPVSDTSPPELAGLGPEGYMLCAGDGGACVESPTAEGLFHGAMTLRQLLERDAADVAIHGVRITDRPRYLWRGFMIDSGRSPNSLPKLKRIIRICSAFKLNFIVFREGDDELNSVRYRSNPLGSENPLAFGMDEVSDLVRYANRYGITVVPEIESLGHSTAKGVHYPDLVSGGFEEPYEGIGTHIRKSHLAPSDPRSYELLESMYDDWLSVNRSHLIHLGLDEVRLPPEDQLRHLEGLLPVVDRVGKKHGIDLSPIVWADAPATPEAYKDRVIRCLWTYGRGEGFGLENRHSVRQGIEELLKDGCREKVFMAAGSSSGHKIGGKTPYDAAFWNIAQWSMLGNDLPNFIGLFAVQWSANMTDDWLPDFAACADCGWNPPSEVPDFTAHYDQVSYQLSRLKDAADPSPDEVDPPAWDAIWLKDGTWYEECRGKTT